MKRTRREAALSGLTLLLLAVLMAVGLMACGDKEDEEADVAKKVEEANEKVKELEEEDEQSREFEFREEESGAVLTKYNGTAEEVVIPEEYNGLAVVKIEANTFKNNETVKTVQIPRTVTGIQGSTLEEGSGVTIRGYENTFAEFYAVGWGFTFESMGENTFEADSVTIWDKEGAHCTTLYRGQIIEDEALKGVTFTKTDGKSVLTLNNCDIGSIEVEEYAALTIELAEGSENKVTGERGRTGISTSGNLTFTGDGKLFVFGSDYYGIVDGAQTGSYLGDGIYVMGNLRVEGNAKVYAKAGKGSKSLTAIGVIVSGGNLTVSVGGMLEAVGSDSAEGLAVAALLVDKFNGRGGEILLDGVNVTGGGAVVPMIYRGTYEDTGEAWEEGGNSSISGESEVVWTEEQGYAGASSHIIIGQ